MANEKKKELTMGERMREHRKELKKSFFTQLSVLMTTAFGFVAALAWNTAIQAAFTKVFGAQGTQLSAELTYAIVVTIVAVLAIFYISRVAAKMSE